MSEHSWQSKLSSTVSEMREWKSGSRLRSNASSIACRQERIKHMLVIAMDD